MDEFLNVIEAACRQKNLSLSAASELATGNKSAFKNMRAAGAARTRRSALQNIKLFAELLELEFYLGPPRETGPIEVTHINDDTFTKIRRYDVEASAGNGHKNSESAPVDHLAFSTEWLSKRGILASKSYLVSVKGDSMQPNLFDGDMVLIDQRKTIVRESKVYALVDIDGSTRVKRIEFVPNEVLILRSDNPANPTEFRTGEDMNSVQILGEVVWSGHSWG